MVKHEEPLNLCQDTESAGMAVDPVICIFNKLCGRYQVWGLGTTFQATLFSKWGKELNPEIT